MLEADWILRIWRFLDTSPLDQLMVGKERRLWDNTRVDILTKTLAVEVDWVYKWKEAIGQSLWYATVTDKKPGICLLYKNLSEDSSHIYRCNTVCVKYNIGLWLVDTTNSVVILPTGERIGI